MYLWYPVACWIINASIIELFHCTGELNETKSVYVLCDKSLRWDEKSVMAEAGFSLDADATFGVVLNVIAKHRTQSWQVTVHISKIYIRLAALLNQ